MAGADAGGGPVRSSHPRSRNSPPSPGRARGTPPVPATPHRSAGPPPRGGPGHRDVSESGAKNTDASTSRHRAHSRHTREVPQPTVTTTMPAAHRTPFVEQRDPRPSILHIPQLVVAPGTRGRYPGYPTASHNKPVALIVHESAISRAVRPPQSHHLRGSATTRTRRSNCANVTMQGSDPPHSLPRPDIRKAMHRNRAGLLRSPALDHAHDASGNPMAVICPRHRSGVDWGGRCATATESGDLTASAGGHHRWQQQHPHFVDSPLEVGAAGLKLPCRNCTPRNTQTTNRVRGAGPEWRASSLIDRSRTSSRQVVIPPKPGSAPRVRRCRR
ncbi:hypothetical protein MLGJGCBP_07677 [Rhodococcus sp. T7]|nr:hypothetical protein MLGJGCBP_07677 [Rhodococcus sp. T7]